MTGDPEPGAELDARLAAADAHEQAAARAQHAKGRRTARERVLALVDQGSFVEQGAFAAGPGGASGDGVVTGRATIDGRPVAVWSQDVTVKGGSLGRVHGRKVAALLEEAIGVGCPVVGLVEGGGARIDEGIGAMAAYGEVFRSAVRASGLVPQLTVVMGAAAGGHGFAPALGDLTIVVDGAAHLFLTGPSVVQTVTGERVDAEQLGGAWVHAAVSGSAHLVAADEQDALELVREVLDHLPSNNLDLAPTIPAHRDAGLDQRDLALDDALPASDSLPHDMHAVIEAVLDEPLLEVQPQYAANIICGFGRIDGQPVGVVANQPQVLAGCLDGPACDKAARFVRTCDAFNLPVVTLVDVPGFLPGRDQEADGVVRRGAKLIHAYAAATVPLVTVIVRKAFGGAFDVMGARSLGADVTLAWPQAQIAVMGAEGAVSILHRGELAEHPDPVARRAELVDEHRNELAGPWQAEAAGEVDAVIRPHQTRRRVADALAGLATKRVERPAKKHGNIPL